MHTEENIKRNRGGTQLHLSYYYYKRRNSKA